MKKTIKPAIRDLESLVGELLKTNPDQNRVRQLMSEKGVPYTSDPIQQMATVLNLLDQKNTVRKTRKSEPEL